MNKLNLKILEEIKKYLVCGFEINDAEELTNNIIKEIESLNGKAHTIQLKNLKDLNFESFNTDTNEGKLLLSAISILTQTTFKTGDKIINGSIKTPDEVFQIIKELAIEIYNSDDKKEFGHCEFCNDNLSTWNNKKWCCTKNCKNFYENILTKEELKESKIGNWGLTFINRYDVIKE